MVQSGNLFTAVGAGHARPGSVPLAGVCGQVQGRTLRGCEHGATVERSKTGERAMFAPAGQTTARACQLCWLTALVVRRQVSGPYGCAFPSTPAPLRSGQGRSLQAGVNGRFVGRGLDPSVPAHVAESCSCFSSVGVAASFSKYRSPLYRIFCRTFSTMVCSVRAVPVRTQSFRARVTPVYKRLR